MNSHTATTDSTAAPSVLITGASTGLGAACALQMDRLGWRVFAGVRSDEAAARIAERARSKNEKSRLLPVTIDVTNPASITAAADEIQAAVAAKGLNALVNNAGIAVSGPLEVVKIERVRQLLEVNVIGQIAVTQAMLPMLRAARGRVVNMGSISGLLATPYLGPYCISKFALEAFSDSLRVELAPWGIAVSLVEPVSIVSDIWDKALVEIERLKAEASPDERALYGEIFEKMDKVTNDCRRLALPVETVTKAVRHALVARRPKTRYLVARPLGKVLLPLLHALPDRMRDWIIRRAL